MTISLDKAQAVTGAVSLTKGSAPVRLEKSNGPIVATCSWRSGTDYDIYALVVLANGDIVHVATFGAKHTPAMPNYRGLVRHLGDVVRPGSDGLATETLEIVMDPSIRAVIPVAYSAQSNGSGSFVRYRVSLTIDNQAGTVVTVSADEANDDDTVYSCVPGIIHNLPSGGVVIEHVELYSRRGSEHRPAAKLNRNGDIVIEMDAGPKNDYK